jgi:hypothetical protein
MINERPIKRDRKEGGRDRFKELYHYSSGWTEENREEC